ncbi:hypothetical protein P879_01432 [Paragonimus westermani]|uniref:RRM domain-containing protein n=1 Tax=Paragonimus westermani TaxID=34504 RepID=A0A8T0DVF2_9TREM|nr:hypothetical protein P879_01432 [Paragonimus westermani]
MVVCSPMNRQRQNDGVPDAFVTITDCRGGFLKMNTLTQVDMAGINLQSGDHLDRFVSEAALAPAVCQSFAGGSSNPPKFGTLIPNRIFVGGIPSNTTEQELKTFFSSFGQVKDVKIINDRLGVSKGSYGFVTFESQEMAEKIIKNESETLIFKDRKLNIGHAIRKQAAAPYATMMLSQPGGSTAVYLPSPLHSTASPYAQLSQQQVAAAALQQQHYQAACPTSAVAPAVAVSHLAPVTVSANNIGTQSNSTTAVMAAAAAAMAAAVQWPQQTATNSLPPPQLASVAAHNVPQAANATHSVISNSSIAAQQAAAMAAAVAAQQAAWRWSPTVNQQHQPQSSAHVTSCSANVSSSGASITATNIMGSTTSTPAIHSQSLHSHQQVSDSSLSILQPAFTSLPTTLRLAQHPMLTASTAALFAAIQQPGLNVLGAGGNGVVDVSTAAALAVLASTSLNRPTIVSPSLLCQPESTVESDNKNPCYLLDTSIDTLDASDTQPSKKPRYDNELLLTPDKASLLNTSYS